MYLKQKDYCFDLLRTKVLNEEKAISKSIKWTNHSIGWSGKIEGKIKHSPLWSLHFKFFQNQLFTDFWKIRTKIKKNNFSYSY